MKTRRNYVPGFNTIINSTNIGFNSSINTFNPLSLSPALWLDASDASTLFQSNGGAAAAADGDPVGYWLDKSASARHFSQTDGTKKPLLKTGANGINSKSTILFDATNDQLQGVLTGLGSGTFSIVTVGKFVSGTKSVFFFGNTAVGGSEYVAAGESGSTSFPPYASSGTVTFKKNGSSVSVPNFGAMFTQFYTGNSFIFEANSVSFAAWTNAFYWMGYTSASYVSSFKFSELLILPSASNTTPLISYLNSKWGVF